MTTLCLLTLPLVLVCATGGCAVRNRLIPAAINRLTVTFGEAGDGDASAELSVEFTRGIYRVEDDNHLTILLVDGEWESPDRLATIRMLWRPRAGKTPVDRSATNATIHFLDLSRGPIGIYSGAGFILPTDPPAGLGGLKLQVTQSNLALSDRAEGYPDQPQRAAISGRVTVSRDDERVLTTMHQVEQLVLERLGYPRLVVAPPQAGLAEFTR